MLPMPDRQTALIAELNLRALECISRFLYADSRAIRQKDVLSLAEDCAISQNDAVILLLCAYCGLDSETRQLDKLLEWHYISTAVQCLCADEFRMNPYYRSIRFPNESIGNWACTTLAYEPYEIFVRDDLLRMPDGREIPQLGYFTERFEYPAVLENGREWMTITPNEIATMHAPLEHMCGRIAMLGLGLGYFAFMASNRSEVEQITIVERDPDVIQLFKSYILPQFPHKDKITILQSDAFEYVEHASDIDCIFVDLWHDVADGIGLYLRMKRLERQKPSVRFEYWIETSLLAWLRSIAIQEWESGEADALLPLLQKHDGWQKLSDDLLREIAHEIPLSIAPE